MVSEPLEGTHERSGVERAWAKVSWTSDARPMVCMEKTAATLGVTIDDAYPYPTRECRAGRPVLNCPVRIFSSGTSTSALGSRGSADSSLLSWGKTHL